MMEESRSEEQDQLLAVPAVPQILRNALNLKKTGRQQSLPDVVQTKSLTHYTPVHLDARPFYAPVNRVRRTLCL